MGACFSALDEPPEGGELAKLTDKLVKEIDALVAKKEKEVMTV